MTRIAMRHPHLFHRATLALHHLVDHTDHFTHVDPVQFALLAVGALVASRHSH